MTIKLVSIYLAAFAPAFGVFLWGINKLADTDSDGQAIDKAE
jgi:hypothetical protein